MLLFLGHLQGYPTAECIRFNERCQVTHLVVIPAGTKFQNGDFTGTTDNSQLELEIFLHAQPLSTKQTQPLKRVTLLYSPHNDPAFPISYPDKVGPCGTRFLIIRSITPYNKISLAICGTVLTPDPPAPSYQQPIPFPQTSSVEDLLSGITWKDMTSSNVGVIGPYVPKMLLGRFDTVAEREARLQFHQDKRLDQQVRSFATAVKVLRQEGVISDEEALELEAKVHDDNAFMSQVIPILCAAMKP